MKNTLILSYCASPMTRGVVVDPVHARGEFHGASVLVDDLWFFVPRDESWAEFQRELLALRVPIACWDLRMLLDWPLSDGRVVWEVKSLHGGNRRLLELARGRFERFVELDSRIESHRRALKTAQIKLHPLQAVPEPLLQEWLPARAKAIRQLWRDGLRAPDARDYEDRWPFVRAVREMELNGIGVDAELAGRLLDGELEPATARALRSLQSLCKGGLVTSLVNPMGGKTGRCRHEGGFNALAVPKGPARTCLVSRFEGGRICALDFNAIDYRCIVRSIGGELAEAYAGSDDFHWRTLELLFPDSGLGIRNNPLRREAIKKVTYTYAYGGSRETLQHQTGLSMPVLGNILGRLDERLSPIAEFRERLYMEAQETGHVEVPGGRRVSCQEADSPGKVLGLYAQSYSSWVVEQAMVRVQRFLRERKSKLEFMVHDELVVDLHPDELEIVEELKRLMELGGNVVRAAQGRSYGELEAV